MTPAATGNARGATCDLRIDRGRRLDRPHQVEPSPGRAGPVRPGRRTAPEHQCTGTRHVVQQRADQPGLPARPPRRRPGPHRARRRPHASRRPAGSSSSARGRRAARRPGIPPRRNCRTATVRTWSDADASHPAFARSDQLRTRGASQDFASRREAVLRGSASILRQWASPKGPDSARDDQMSGTSGRRTQSWRTGEGYRAGSGCRSGSNMKHGPASSVPPFRAAGGSQLAVTATWGCPGGTPRRHWRRPSAASLAGTGTAEIPLRSASVPVSS